MLKIVLLSLAGILILFLGYVAMRPKNFHYERSGLIKASPDKIFPHISQLKLGGAWSPYEKRDPQMKKSFTGTDGMPGAKMDFDGNKEVGAGSVELKQVSLNQEVVLRLLMTRPFAADHTIRYRLEPAGDQTKFTWSMEGENGFLGKLVTTLIDCDAMLGKDMNEGIKNLKLVVE